MLNKDPSNMSQKYKKVQTIQTVTYKVIRTYFIDADKPDTDSQSSSYMKDTDFLCYEPTDEEVIDKTVTDEEVI